MHTPPLSDESGDQKMVVHLRQHALSICAPTVLSGPTKRPAAVLIWSTTGKPFKLTDLPGGQQWVGQAALLAPQLVRSTHARECGVISLNFEPGHPKFPALAHMTQRDGLVALDHRRLRPYSNDLSQLIASNDGPCLDELTSHIAENLLDRLGTTPYIDRRIAAAAGRLESELAHPPSVRELARQAHLSEDRFSHLFTREIGLSVRSYVVWRRYRLALLSLKKRANLAEVAQTVGFYDQAHMTRTFVGFFGYQPSLLRNDDFIRITGKGWVG